MIAMQYSLSLPADYDMTIIDRRIRERGSLLDGFPGLAFKAYLSARRGDLGSLENLYAPFYVWREAEGLSNFVCGPGFATLADDFGRPPIRTWIVWRSTLQAHLGGARFAVRSCRPIGAGADLSALRQSESAAAEALVTGGDALATVVGFDPTSWSLVRFRLLADEPSPETDAQVYRVGHVSPGP